MNSTQAGRRNKKRFWLRGPVLLASVPLILFGMFLIALGLHEKAAAERVQAEIARIRDVGDPIDDASMSRWFIEHTSRQGTKDWNEILRLVRNGESGFGSIDRFPYVGPAPVPPEIPRAGEWAEEAEVAEYLRWMQPVIQQIHQATDYPHPVWQPIEFDGFKTLLEELQESRSIVRLLQLEAEHAIYHRDAERALRALDSMQGLAAAFDWPFCMVGELVQIALRGIHQSMIRRSLAADLWNEDQLQRLAEQLGPPREIPQRWQDIIAGERAMAMSTLEDPDFWDYQDPDEPTVFLHRWMIHLPSVREHLLERYRDMEIVAASGLEELTERAEKLERRWNSDAERSRLQLLSPNSIAEMILPAVHGFALAMEREENSRRHAVTALAIKRFQMQEGNWPESLAELERVGIHPRDTHTVSGGRLGYTYLGDEAYLWSYYAGVEPRVSPTRPMPNVEEGGPPPEVITIR